MNAYNISQAVKCEEAPRLFTSKDKIKEIYFALQNAKRPLLVIGKGGHQLVLIYYLKKPFFIKFDIGLAFFKGAAYAQAENELNKLVKKLKLPFLPTPMGKGVVDDNNELCIAAARST